MGSQAFFMVVLAKVQDGELYVDLRTAGFTPGHVIDCPHCDCSYRVFYGPDDLPESVMVTATRLQSLDQTVEQAHPDHRESRLRVTQS